MDNLDLISSDNLEISDECPSDGDTMDNNNDGPDEFGDCPKENQSQMEVQDQMEVSLGTTIFLLSRYTS